MCINVHVHVPCSVLHSRGEFKYFVLINLWVEFPDASIFKNEEIMAQWNKICKYKVKITGFSTVFMMLTRPPDYFERHFNSSAAILTGIWLGKRTTVVGWTQVYVS